MDHLAFLVGLRLMGPDARRRLRLALVRSSDFTGPANFDILRFERLGDLLEGKDEPQTLQERWDVARAVAERATPTFDPAFWAERTAELVRAGFPTGSRCPACLGGAPARVCLSKRCDYHQHGDGQCWLA